MIRLFTAFIFNRKLYERWKSYNRLTKRLNEYNRRLANGDFKQDDILPYLYYVQQGSWNELIERFGEQRVRQLELMGYIRHYDEHGIWI